MGSHFPHQLNLQKGGESDCQLQRSLMLRACWTSDKSYKERPPMPVRKRLQERTEHMTWLLMRIVNFISFRKGLHNSHSYLLTAEYKGQVLRLWNQTYLDSTVCFTAYSMNDLEHASLLSKPQFPQYERRVIRKFV